MSMDAPGNLEALSDEALFADARDNPAAFGPLVDRYWRKLCGFVRRTYLFGPEDAQDVVQEAFIKAYRHVHAFDASLSFSAWMYRIVRNAAVDALRRRSARPFTVSTDDEERPIAIVAPDAHAAALTRIEAESVARIIQELPVKYREAMVLRDLEGHTYEEIADILKAPKGTVASLVNRGRKMVRERADALGIHPYGA